MPGEALGVGDDDLVGGVAEDRAQGVDLGCRAAATGRRVGLVGDEDRLGRDRGAIHATGFGLADHVLHHGTDVLDIETSAVERAVGGDGAQYLTDRLDAALARCGGTLDDEGGCAHPDDHPVPALVERHGCRGDVVVGGGRAGGEEAGADPTEQVIARHVVGGDDHDAPAPAGADPVLGQGDGLGRARACRVHLGVRAAGTDEIGELGVPHREHAEQEATIEEVGVCGERVLDIVDPPVDLTERGVRRVGVRDACPDRLQLLELDAPRLVLLVARDLVRQLFQAGEGAREDDAGVVAQHVGEAPAVRELGAEVGRAVALHERDARIAQRIDSGADGQLGGAAERGHTVGLDAELGGDVERAGPAGELDHIGDGVDRLEAGATGFALGEPDDVLVEDLVADASGDHVDQLLAVQDAGDVLVVEHLGGAGRAQRSPGDDDRLRADARRAATGGDDRARLVQEVGEQRSEVGVHGKVLSRECDWGCDRRWGDSRWNDSRWNDSRWNDSRWNDGRRAAGAVACGVEPAQRLVERHDVGQLGMVRGQHADVVVAEHVAGEAGEGALRAGLDEDARPGLVEGVQPAHELDRRGHLPGQQIEHLLGHFRSHRVQVAGDVRDDRTLRRMQLQPFEGASQGLAGGGDDAGVEGMAHRQPSRDPPLLVARRDGGLDGSGGPADHGLGIRVDVGEHDVALDAVDERLHLGDGCEDRRHHAVVLGGEVCHLAPACAHCFERGIEAQRSGSHERAVLAEAVADHDVGLDPVRAEQLGDGEVGGEYGGLRDLGVAEIGVGLGHRIGIGAVDEDVVGQRLAEQRGHHAVGVAEQLGDDRLGLPQAGEHVDVLRSLAGVHEGHRLGRAAAAEDAAAPQRFPHRRLLERAERLGGLVEEFGCVAEIDRDAFRCGQVGGEGRFGRRNPVCCGLVSDGLQPLDEAGLVRGPDYEGAAQGHLRFRNCHRDGRRRNSEVGTDGDGSGGLTAQPAGDVLLEHHVEVRAAKTERAHAGGTHRPARNVPTPQLGVDAERRHRPVDIRVRLGEVEARWEDAMVQRERCLQHAGSAGRSLQVPDVRLDRTECDRARAQVGAREDLAETRDLHDVTDACARAVGLDERARSRGQPGRPPRALHREPLPDRVRRRDPLAPPVAGAGDATNHRIDTVAVALGIGEPLQEEQGRALAHHEAVRPCVERASTRGRESADLAELHVARGAHVAIDTAGDHGVELVCGQAVDRRVERGHRRSARGVDDEVGPVEIEQVGDASRHHVAELARHGVLGDLGEAHSHPYTELLDDRPAHLGRQGRERWRALELACHLREGDAERRQVVVLAGHRIAEDDGRALVVDRFAVVLEQRVGTGEGPLLPVVHRIADAWRDRELPGERIPLPLADPSADLRVRLVGRLVIGIEVERRVPAVGGDIANRVATGRDVGPEARSVGRVGQDRRYGDDGNGLHHDVLSMSRIDRRRGEMSQPRP